MLPLVKIFATQFRHIVFDPDILGGKPIIKGSRISVQLILEWVASGASVSDIVAEFPHLQPPFFLIAENKNGAVRIKIRNLRPALQSRFNQVKIGSVRKVGEVKSSKISTPFVPSRTNSPQAFSFH